METIDISKINTTFLTKSSFIELMKIRDMYTFITKNKLNIKTARVTVNFYSELRKKYPNTKFIYKNLTINCC